MEYDTLEWVDRFNPRRLRADLDMVPQPSSKSRTTMRRLQFFRLPLTSPSLYEPRGGSVAVSTHRASSDALPVPAEPVGSNGLLDSCGVAGLALAAGLPATPTDGWKLLNGHVARCSGSQGTSRRALCVSNAAPFGLQAAALPQLLAAATLSPAYV